MIHTHTHILGVVPFSMPVMDSEMVSKSSNCTRVVRFSFGCLRTSLPSRGYFLTRNSIHFFVLLLPFGINNGRREREICGTHIQPTSDHEKNGERKFTSTSICSIIMEWWGVLPTGQLDDNCAYENEEKRFMKGFMGLIRNWSIDLISLN